MERLMNARMEASAEVMEWLAGPASYLDVQFKQIAGQLGPGSVISMPESRWAAVEPAR